MFKFKFQKALEYKSELEEDAKYILLKKREEENEEQENFNHFLFNCGRIRLKFTKRSVLC